MNALTRIERLDDLFPDFVRQFMRTPRMDADLPSDIRLDLTENPKEYLVSAELPGVRKDDVRVVIDGNYVSITAEVKKETEDKSAGEGRYLARETYRGTLSRGFTLAHEVDDKAAVAKLENGVLRLTLPKRTGASSRLLAIQ